MEVLTPQQQRLLQIIAQLPLARDSVWLSGGTALAHYHLSHRLSEDLDWVTAAPGAVEPLVQEMLGVLEAEGAELEIVRRLPTFATLFAILEGERIKMDIAQDSPFRLAPLCRDERLGIQYENARDICANKLSALFDRAQGRDFVDVYFAQANLFPMESIIADARAKFVGIDDYWLARAFAQVRSVGPLPRMLKPLDVGAMKSFFLDWARKLVGALASP